MILYFIVEGSTSRLDGTSSARDRSLWSLQQRSIGGGGTGVGAGGGGGGSAWARSTTTRDSPVLSGLTDGLSSLFSVVEHSGSTESLWRSDGGQLLHRPSAVGGVTVQTGTSECGLNIAAKNFSCNIWTKVANVTVLCAKD